MGGGCKIKKVNSVIVYEQKLQDHVNGGDHDVVITI